MTASAAIGGARPDRIRCDRSRSMTPVLTSPSIDVDTCSASTTLRMTSSDCSLVGTRPATVDASRQGDGGGIARGDDDRRRHGSPANRPRGQEQLVDLPA